MTIEVFEWASFWPFFKVHPLIYHFKFKLCSFPSYPCREEFEDSLHVLYDCLCFNNLGVFPEFKLYWFRNRNNASVMTGINAEVHKKRMELWNHPVILIRCCCHSLVLAINSARDEWTYEFGISRVVIGFLILHFVHKTLYKAIYDDTNDAMYRT